MPNLTRKQLEVIVESGTRDVLLTKTSNVTHQAVGVTDLAQTALTLLNKVESLQQEIEQYQAFARGLEQTIKELTLKLSNINDCCVEFHELGPHDEKEALRRVM